MDKKPFSNDGETPINKDYCDEVGIQAEWFKFSRTLATLLKALVSEDTDENGKWHLKDAYILACTVYAIICYLLDGSIPSELEEKLNSAGMKLSKLAVNEAIDAIELGRLRIAENRINGGKGGNARRNK